MSARPQVRRLVAHPLTQDQGLSFGDAVFSLEMLKGAVAAKVSSYRAHLRPADFAKIFTADGSFGDARKSEDAKVAELRASIASASSDASNRARRCRQSTPWRRYGAPPADGAGGSDEALPSAYHSAAPSKARASRKYIPV